MGSISGCRHQGQEGVREALSLIRSILMFVISYLGYVDLKGNPYTSSTIATGYGAHIGQPLLRKAVEGREDTMTHDEAKALLEECMRVLFYRDARSLNKVSSFKL